MAAITDASVKISPAEGVSISLGQPGQTTSTTRQVSSHAHNYEMQSRGLSSAPVIGSSGTYPSSTFQNSSYPATTTVQGTTYPATTSATASQREAFTSYPQGQSTTSYPQAQSTSYPQVRSTSYPQVQPTSYPQGQSTISYGQGQSTASYPQVNTISSYPISNYPGTLNQGTTYPSQGASTIQGTNYTGTYPQIGSQIPRDTYPSTGSLSGNESAIQNAINQGKIYAPAGAVYVPGSLALKSGMHTIYDSKLIPTFEMPLTFHSSPSTVVGQMRPRGVSESSRATGVKSGKFVVAQPKKSKCC